MPRPDADPSRGLRASLRNRDLVIYLVGQGVSATGSWFHQLAVGWLALDLTGSPLAVAVVAGSRPLAVLLLSLPAGIVIGDRYDRRAVMMIANSVAMGLSILLAGLTLLEWIAFNSLLALSIALGIVHAMELPARATFVGQLGGPRNMANAIALNAVVFNGARVLGPALAGVAIVAFGTGAALGMNALSYLAIIAGLMLITRRPSTATATGSGLVAMREAIGFLRTDVRSRLIIGLVAGQAVCVTAYLILAPAVAVALGSDAQGAGFLVACTGIGAVVAGLHLAAGSRPSGRWRLLLVAGGANGLCQILIALSPPIPVASVLMVGAGWGMVTLSAMSNTLVQQLAPDSMRGRVMSVYALAMPGLVPVGSLLAGAIGEAFGTLAALAVGAIIWLVILLLVFARSNALRTL